MGSLMKDMALTPKRIHISSKPPNLPNKLVHNFEKLSLPEVCYGPVGIYGPQDRNPWITGIGHF